MNLFAFRHGRKPGDESTGYSRRGAAGRLSVAALILCLAVLCGCGSQSSGFDIQAEGETGNSSGINAPVQEQQLPEPTPTPAPTPMPTPTPAPTPTPTPQPSEKPGGIATLYRRPETESPAASEVMDPALSQKSRIQKIREWYGETEGLGDALESHIYNDDITSFWHEGDLVKVDVREALDTATQNGLTYHYYYRDGAPYFAYVVGANPRSELRLYFWNGELIRWLETDHVIHQTANEKYAAYFDGASSIYQSILELETPKA